MRTLKSTLTEYFNIRRKTGAYLWIEDPRVNDDQIKHILRTVFQCLVPSELVEIYTICNGFGLCSNQANEHLTQQVQWILPKIEDYSAFVKEKRFFSKTHKYASDRFFPVLNFDDNVIGYYFGLELSQKAEVFLFDHELYLVNTAQPIEEFFIPMSKSINEYLMYEMKFY